MRLSSELLSRLSAGILRMYAPAAPSEIPSKFLGVVRAIMGCEDLSYNEFENGQFSCVLDPIVTPAFSEIFTSLSDQHPSITFLRQTRSRGAVKISDFMTTNEWYRTELYNEFFRKLDIRHQIGFMFLAGTVEVGFAANRKGRDFSETDRLILNILAAHLSQAIQNARALAKIQERMHHVADSPRGGGTIVFTCEGNILFCSHKAADCLQRFWGPLAANKLPEALYSWLQPVLNHPTFDHLSSGVLHPFTKVGEKSSLSVRFVPNHTANEHLLILEEQFRELPYSVFKEYGLTDRESEVLNWVMQGKTNPEIAIILNISVKTAGHHIEHIMEKLGVERRGGAALWAQQTLRSFYA
jgi:DNA-binding CsgD family transcriptional regulator